MPCDVCSKAEGCYALSTTETITNPLYWEYFFRHHYPQQVELIGRNGEKLGSYVLFRAEDSSGWALCESCIQMYSIDRNEARQRFKAWEQAGKPPTDYGVAPIKPSIDAAKEGWKRVFGSEPCLDLPPDIASRPVMETSFTTREAEDKEVKKWWRFWRYLGREDKFSDDILFLVCPHCNQKYLIGEDSILMTVDAAFEMVAKLGGIIPPSLPKLLQGPDLVMYGGDLTIELRKENIERVAQLRGDLRRGIKRSWRCSKCQDGDSIPIPYPTL